ALPPELFVVSARAPFSFMGSGYAWYQLRSMGVPDEATFQQSLDLLAPFLSNLPERYPVDPGRLFLGGFSQGAMMCASTTLIHPALVLGTAVLSGYLPTVELPIDRAGCAGKPVFLAHGRQDSVLPLAMGHDARRRLEELGLAVEYHEYAMDHQVVPSELDDLAAWLRARLAS
ncbi:MAG: alpha/beta hydrolase, partial [Chloroflexota bacterium]